MGTIQHNPIALALIAAPLAIFTILVAWLILPTLLENVVSQVVRNVVGS
jgi:hypothetical protein